MIAAAPLSGAGGRTAVARCGGESPPVGPATIFARRDPRQLHFATAPRVRATLTSHDSATEMEHRRVGVGVSLTLKGWRVHHSQGRLGAVAPTVLLVEAAAKALIGRNSTMRAECRCWRLLRRVPSDRRQARHHCLPHQVAGVWKRTAAIAATALKEI